MVDRFPRIIQPMLASSVPPPEDLAANAYEFKWDGFRAIATWDGRAFRLSSRNQQDLTPSFPSLLPLKTALARLGPTAIDGEIVIFDEKGRPDFNRLQNADARSHAAYMIFDVLYAGGKNLMPLPFTERRKILTGLKLKGRSWNVPPSKPGGRDEMLEIAKKNGYEGLIAKRLSSPYRPGDRSGEWVKIKFARRQEFVIGGWLPGEGANHGSMGSLLLGYYSEGRLRFAGKVGTGFSRVDRIALMEFLKKIKAPANPFADRVPFRNAVFALPRLVGEVEFFEWTPDGKVRHPSFKGLRTDKPADEVIREPVPT